MGITELSRPDFGDPVKVAPGELPVFWAVMASTPPFAITHAPGYMFVTDIPDTAYRLT